MKSSVKATMVLGAMLAVLTACNTTAGVGRDISSAGNAITRSAGSVQQGSSASGDTATVQKH